MIHLTKRTSLGAALRTVAAGLLVSAVMAPQASASVAARTGNFFYAKLIANAASYSNKLSYTAGAPRPNRLNFNPDLSKKSFIPGLAIGYEFDMANFFVGAELDFQFANAKSSQEISSAGGATYNTSVTNKSMFGASLRFGPRFGSGSRAYAIVGATRGKTQLTSTMTYGAPARDYPNSTSKTSTGLRLGLGVETPVVQDCLLVGIEGNYYRFSNAKLTTTTAPNGFTKDTVSVKPSVTTVGIHLKYRY